MIALEPSRLALSGSCLTWRRLLRSKVIDLFRLRSCDAAYPRAALKVLASSVAGQLCLNPRTQAFLECPRDSDLGAWTGESTPCNHKEGSSQRIPVPCSALNSMQPQSMRPTLRVWSSSCARQISVYLPSTGVLYLGNIPVSTSLQVGQTHLVTSTSFACPWLERLAWRSPSYQTISSCCSYWGWTIWLCKDARGDTAETMWIAHLLPENVFFEMSCERETALFTKLFT